MKNLVIALLLVFTIALGAFSWHQKQQLAQIQTQLADAQTQLSKKPVVDEDAVRAERNSKLLQTALADTSKYADEKAKQTEQLQKSLAAEKTNNVNPFAKMFKDPAMREMIKSQQKAVLGPMISKQYAAFFQKAGLTPDQTAAMKDLLQQKMSAGTEAGMSMMDDSLDATQRADMAKQVKSQTDDYEAQIKQLLGDDNYQAYQAYEKTTPDRMVVSQFTDQLADGSTSLSADQQDQLIQAISDTRNSFKWTTDYSNKNPPDGNYAAMFTDDKLAQFAQEKETLDQQVLARVQSILTPEQLATFQQFQTSQRELQMAGMKMASQMFKK